MTEEVKKEKIVDAAKPTLWIITTVILAIALVASVAGSGITGNFLANNNPNKAASSAITFINDNILTGQATAQLINITEKGGLYLMAFNVGNQTYTSYLTKDGKMLFPQAIDMTTAPEPILPSAFDAPNVAKPKVEMFVMAFCPYGQQAEAAMKPVFELIGDKVTIEPHFIVAVNNGTVQSLHGDYEAQEDMRQACILKNYAPAKWWNYISYINANCSKSNIATCWKDAAKAADINATAIESCAATEGVKLMEAEMALSDEYGVQGSPTIIINGAEYSGARSADAYKEGICTGFTEAPSECNSALSSTAASASGGCGS